MLFLLPIVIALAAEPSSVPDASAPTPAPAAASTATNPTPLREIGRVRALPACVPIVAHANGAITHALDNDRGIAIMSLNLHNLDFERMSEIQRNNAIEDILKQAGAVRDASHAGDEEIKRLRELAKASPDPQRQQELKDFADALGGALARQTKAAAEVTRDIVIMRGREETSEAHTLMARSAPGTGYPQVQAAAAAAINNSPLTPPDPHYNRQMKQIGDAMDDRVKSIVVDEGKAADHSIAATSGC